MKKIDTTDLQKDLDNYLDIAQAEVVIVSDSDEPKVAMVPYAVYKQFRAASPNLAVRVSDLPEDAIKAILEAEVPEDDS